MERVVLVTGLVIVFMASLVCASNFQPVIISNQTFSNVTVWVCSTDSVCSDTYSGTFSLDTPSDEVVVYLEGIKSMYSTPYYFSSYVDDNQSNWVYNKTKSYMGRGNITLSDLPISLPANGDTTHISTSAQVYTFVTGQGYLSAEDDPNVGTVTNNKWCVGDADGVIQCISDNPDTVLSQEDVEDYVGNMVTGNTETGITVTYEDSDGTLDFVVSGGTSADVYLNITALQDENKSVWNRVILINASVPKWDGYGGLIDGIVANVTNINGSVAYWNAQGALVTSHTGYLNSIVTNLTNINSSVALWDESYGWGDHASAGYASATNLNALVTNVSNINASVAKWDSAIPQSSLNNVVTNLSNINASVSKWDSYEGFINTLTTNATTAHTEIDAVRTNLTNINGSVATWDATATLATAHTTSINNIVTNLTNINSSVAAWNAAASLVTSHTTSIDNIVTNLTNVNASVAKWNSYGAFINTLTTNVTNALTRVDSVVTNLSNINASVAKWDSLVSGGTAEDVYLNITSLQVENESVWDRVLLINASVPKWDNLDLNTWVTPLNGVRDNLTLINASVAKWDNLVGGGTEADVYLNITSLQAENESVWDSVNAINDSVAKWDNIPDYGDWSVSVDDVVANLTLINASVALWDEAYLWGDWATPVDDIVTNLTAINASVGKWNSYGAMIDTLTTNATTAHTEIDGVRTNLTNINASVAAWDAAATLATAHTTGINNIVTNLTAMNGSVAVWNSYGGVINNIVTNLTNINASVAVWNSYAGAINTLTTNATTAHTEIDGVRSNLTNINASVAKWDAASVVLGDVVTTAPITGGVNDILPGVTGTKITIALTQTGDILCTGGASCAAGADKLPGSVDVTIAVATKGLVDTANITTNAGAMPVNLNMAAGFNVSVSSTGAFNFGNGCCMRAYNTTHTVHECPCGI